MPFSLLPSMMTDAATDLTASFLRSRDIRLLMLDFDNTIVPYTTDAPTEKMTAWLRDMRAAGVELCVVSNSRNVRVEKFCQEYALPCITRARKPGTRGVKECLLRYGISPKHAALVGDQIYTDTIAANCAGVTSILVRAIHNHNIWLKLRHVAELPIIFLAQKRRVKT